MKEVKEAYPVRTYRIDNMDELYVKVSKSDAECYPDVAVKALYRSTISWFVPFESIETPE